MFTKIIRLVGRTLKYLSGLAAILLALFAGFSLMVQRSCSATWFEVAGVHIMPAGLDVATGRVDTSGQYSSGLVAGFALHITPEYVAQAAIEPGILGLLDTLSLFTVEIPDGQGGWTDATAQFFYGLPEDCEMLSPEVFYRGNTGIRWYADWPDNARKQVDLADFKRRFNGKWLSGLEVSGLAFTFWLKPGAALNTDNSLHFRVRIETQKGKKWMERIDINRVLSPAECLEYLKKVTAGDSITLLYDTCTSRFRHFIFIDHNRRSKFYEPLLDFDLNEWEQEQYDDFLKKQQDKTPVSLPPDLPRQWVIVHEYKNEYCAYYPSDFGYHYQVQLNETAFIGFQMDGPELYRLASVDRPDKSHWNIRCHSGETIRLERSAPGSPVWRWKFADRQYLMTPAEALRDFPLIVNYCKEQKQMEFRFGK